MPETVTNAKQVTGVLDALEGDAMVLRIPETSYQIHLKVTDAPKTPVGKRISGMIQVQARRIDKVGTGGRYVEPVEGRPRRVQGSVIAVDPADRTITVSAGVPIVCRTDERQTPGDFEVGDFVTMGVNAGATFTPAG